MATAPTVGVVGDLDAGNETHRLTNDALARLDLPHEWVPTDEIARGPAKRLEAYSGVFIAPGSPYRNMEGALAAIQHARETGLPLVGT
jgi:CTP synthase (UTP-ammonia lyase)